MDDNPIDDTQINGDGRERTYSWLDPAPFLAALPTTPGLALLEAMMRGEVLARGARTATAQARLVDANDRLIAHATSTCLLFPIGGSRPA